MSRPSSVRLVEMGPRDGLQNEPAPVATDIKIALIERLAAAGLKTIEAGSFVSPSWVPQMANSAEIYRRIKRFPGVSYPALVPNLKGLEAALGVGIEEVAVFVAASEGFSQRNIACSRAESLERLAPVAKLALQKGLRLRGYVSCIIACPYDGPVAPDQVAEMSERLVEMGCYEVSASAPPTRSSGSSKRWRRASRENASPCIFTTPTAKGWPMFWPAWTREFPSSTARWPGWAAVPLPRGRPAMWRPRMFCICCMGWVSRPVSI